MILIRENCLNGDGNLWKKKRRTKPRLRKKGFRGEKVTNKSIDQEISKFQEKRQLSTKTRLFLVFALFSIIYMSIGMTNMTCSPDPALTGSATLLPNPTKAHTDKKEYRALRWCFVCLMCVCSSLSKYMEQEWKKLAVSLYFLLSYYPYEITFL